MTKQDKQAETLRRLLRYGAMLIALLTRQGNMQEVEYLHDAIADGELLLRQLGRTSVR